jgi:hypothetical protein
VSEPIHTTLLNATIHSIASNSLFGKVLVISCELACDPGLLTAIFVEADYSPTFYLPVRGATSLDAYAVNFGESYVLYRVCLVFAISITVLA